MEDERDLVTFTDEEGNEFDLEVIDYFDHKGKEYAVLVDADLPEDPEEDFEVCIMEIVVNEEEDMEEFVPVSDDLLDELWAIAQKRMECWDCDADDCEGCEKLED
ncbi:MAG: DUF1292 domain-containing protein [Clostridia bacterium]|jgi:uncharacterized protein YrzB (UPF0473 family)|nr:DUF1292 domain-containing protein [Clostridia bacterium]MBR0436772.1 DUF1292 domain-containing protein [Clostridia bacterium]MBR2645627.1 DUF1292 domain-containing protein [Clostridia bacterium]MBR3037673.1 DUF1292 domain-containing protein [Clostridia bacterium]MBR3129277.1 DUF1292 domain-containing protein [Clostridia bacterium]